MFVFAPWEYSAQSNGVGYHCCISSLNVNEYEAMNVDKVHYRLTPDEDNKRNYQNHLT
jgi:hypothetical protein